MQLSTKIKICRQNNNLTQAQFAKKLNVSRKTVSGWENNRSFPDITTLVQLSNTFDISLDLLLKDSDDTVEYYQSTLNNGKRNPRAIIFVYFALMITCFFSYLKLLNAFLPTHYLTSIALVFFLITYIMIYPKPYKFNSLRKITLGLLLLLGIFVFNAFIFVLTDKEPLIVNDPSYFLGNIVGLAILAFMTSITVCVLIFCIPEPIAKHFKRHNEDITVKSHH